MKIIITVLLTVFCFSSLSAQTVALKLGSNNYKGKISLTTGSAGKKCPAKQYRRKLGKNDKLTLDNLKSGCTYNIGTWGGSNNSLLLKTKKIKMPSGNGVSNNEVTKCIKVLSKGRMTSKGCAAGVFD